MRTTSSTCLTNWESRSARSALPKKRLADNKQNYPGRPGICRNCGALVGAAENSCHVCGAPVGQAAASAIPLHERYAMSYARAVLSRPYIFTIIFLIANFFVFMLMWESSGMKASVLWTGFSEDVLLAYGAKMNYWIYHEYQWWRFITPVFHPRQPAARADQYVQSLDNRPLGREALRLGKVRRVLDRHRHRRGIGKLPDCDSRVASRFD